VCVQCTVQSETVIGVCTVQSAGGGGKKEFNLALMTWSSPVVHMHSSFKSDVQRTVHCDVLL